MTRESRTPNPPADGATAVVLAALDELKGRDVRTLDVRDQTAITDWLVVASGTSQRHIRALADRVLERTRAAGIPSLGSEGERGSDWILLDLGDVVVHVMTPEKRDFYSLERLWSMRIDESATDAG